MSRGGSLPTAATRSTLHRVAVHVLARRRFSVTGRFGLRASPGGFATPAFGSEPEVLRVAGTSLIRETGSVSAWTEIDGSSLRDLAGFAGADLDVDFDSGGDMPATGDLDAPLGVDRTVAAEIADWYALGWSALDDVVASLPVGGSSATVQLWPEHFDAATVVAAEGKDRVNLGFSPGDSYSERP